MPGRAAVPVAAAAFSGVRMRTHVYVDGYNLYFGSLKGTPHKWLNQRALCSALMPQNDIRAIRYFTAQVSGTPHDPDQPNRQQTYFRALQPLAHFIKQIRPGALANAQFPVAMNDAKGQFHKPARW